MKICRLERQFVVDVRSTDNTDICGSTFYDFFWVGNYESSTETLIIG